MNRYAPDEHGRYHILYPQDRRVLPDVIIGWAQDELANGETDIVSEVKTIEDAIEVLEDTGSVTFATR